MPSNKAISLITNGIDWPSCVRSVIGFRPLYLIVISTTATRIIELTTAKETKSMILHFAHVRRRTWLKGLVYLLPESPFHYRSTLALSTRNHGHVHPTRRTVVKTAIPMRHFETGHLSA
jgi:hypothetical protein